MTATLIERLSRWVAGLDAVPETVRLAADRAILDTLGVIAAGARHATVIALRNGFADGGGTCSLVGGGTASPAVATLINGAAAHVWDFDDTSYTGIMHGSAVVLPAALAVAEETGADGRAFLTAFVAGSEIAYCVADAATHHHYLRGWWSTATFGLIGATAAAAKLYRLDAGKTADALGLAVAAAAGTKTVFGTGAKPYLVGEAACRAVGFARAARAGISGPTDAFENPNGFFALLCDGRRDAVSSLGERWRLVDPGLLFKSNPVCSAAHAAIEETARLLGEAGLTADQIASVRCEIPKLVDLSLVYDRPEIPQQAQFSLPFAVACAALFGRVRLQDLSLETLRNPDIAKNISKVEKAVAEDLSTDDMRLRHPECARVTIRLVDGRSLAGFCADPYGMPSRPMSDADLLQKFEGCMAFAGKDAVSAAELFAGLADGWDRQDRTLPKTIAMALS